MIKPLSYDEFKIDKNVNLEYTLKTCDDCCVEFFVEVDFKKSR